MRQISAELESYFDHKLANFGAAHEAIKNKDARAVVQYAALASIGIREEGGANKGRLVRLMTDTVGGPGVIPWCMAAVQSWIAYAEEKCGAKSPIVATEHCMTCWNTTPKAQRVKIFPAPGAIIIWRHGTSAAGHTGIFLEGNRLQFSAVEGNTGGGLDSTGEIVREGDGVYKTKRKFGHIGNMKLVGFLKPF